jgi:hypothetical protein
MGAASHRSGVLQWMPTVCWSVAGVATVLNLAVAGVERWATQ